MHINTELVFIEEYARIISPDLMISLVVLFCFLPKNIRSHTDETVTRYLTCDRTQDDEHSRFVRFQILCLVLGVVSFIWVRRFRVVYASLFEQRKLSMLRRPSDTPGGVLQSEDDGPGAIELMATREEVSPLNNPGLEVV